MATTTPPTVSKVIIDGVFESGLGLLLGSGLDLIAPSPDSEKGWQAITIEVAAQLGINAVLIQTAGQFIITRISPDNSSAGILLGWGMFLGQPGLQRKVQLTVAGLKAGLAGLASQNAGLIAKTMKA